MESWIGGVRVSIPPDAPHRADGPPGVMVIGDQNWLIKSYSYKNIDKIRLDTWRLIAHPDIRQWIALWTFTTYDDKTVATANFNHTGKIISQRTTHLLAAKSPPEIAALLGGGVVLRVVGGEGLDQIRVSRFNLKI